MCVGTGGARSQHPACRCAPRSPWRASSRTQVTPSSFLSASRTGGRPPWRPSICAHATRRGVHRRGDLAGRLPPPAAISSCVRQTVGTDATRPSNSRWSPVIRKSLISCAPLATAQARSDSTRPAHAPASACWPALPTARQSAPSHPTVAAAAPAPRGTPLPPRRPGTVDDCGQPFVPDQVAPAR
jgi:hypothetical protein